MKKWIVPIILAIVGVICLILAIEFLTTSIGSLPSFLGGHVVPGRHPHGGGHYHLRGAILVLVAVALFAVAIFLGFFSGKKTAQAPSATAGSVAKSTTATSSSADLLSQTPAGEDEEGNSAEDANT